MKNSFYYEIFVEGCIPESYGNLFEGMSVRFDYERKTTSIGKLADQAALIDVINKIQSLNLIVISVKRCVVEEQLEE